MKYLLVLILLTLGCTSSDSVSKMALKICNPQIPKYKNSPGQRQDELRECMWKEIRKICREKKYDVQICGM